MTKDEALEYLRVTNETFIENKGVNLERALPLGDVETDKEIELLSKEALRRITNEVNKRSIHNLDLTELTEYQLDALKEAVMDLISYLLKAGDVYSYDGNDGNGSRVALMPSFIIDDLHNAGIIRRAL